MSGRYHQLREYSAVSKSESSAITQVTILIRTVGRIGTSDMSAFIQTLAKDTTASVHHQDLMGFENGTFSLFGLGLLNQILYRTIFGLDTLLDPPLVFMQLVVCGFLPLLVQQSTVPPRTQTP